MDEVLFQTDPATLVDVRNLCHHACQWPSTAARANLAPREDDSHSNLGWVDSLAALVSHPLDRERRRRLGFGFDDQAMLWLMDDHVDNYLPLAQTQPDEIDAWVDECLTAAGLRPTREARVPYALDGSVDFGQFAALAAGARSLGAWYQAGHGALVEIATALQPIAVSPLSVRCWPHHFDVAILVSLEAGDPEMARSIGIGMSPGDASYAEPYFYCSPWPAPDVASLPAPPAPLSWHTAGFVSLVCAASAMSPATDLNGVLEDAVANVRTVLEKPR